MNNCTLSWIFIQRIEKYNCRSGLGNLLEFMSSYDRLTDRSFFFILLSIRKGQNINTKFLLVINSEKFGSSGWNVHTLHTWFATSLKM